MRKYSKSTKQKYIAENFRWICLCDSQFIGQKISLNSSKCPNDVSEHEGYQPALPVKKEYSKVVSKHLKSR